MRTAEQMLDGLEALVAGGDCPGIVNDDNGHWAVTGAGMQNVVCGDEPQDVNTTFYVEASMWKNSLREAIEAYLDESVE